METRGNFDLLNRVKVKYGDVVISKWRSRVSGLSLVHIDYPGEWPTSSACHKTKC